MSEDEFFALLVSLAATCFGAWYWVWPCYRVHAQSCSASARLLLLAIPVVCAMLLFAVLLTLAAADVVGSPIYLSFYLLMGAGYVALVSRGFPLVGVSLRRDALERGNRAAALALGGAMIGLTFCFAGGNIGDGPGWWVVIFSALLATAAWYALWLALQTATNIMEHVTVDRDTASALRLAGYLIASGLILGRAVAGDWESPEQTVADFLRMWLPALALTALACVAEYVCRPTPHWPRPPASLFGVLPAAMYLSIAAIWLTMVGLGR
jgi:hypothetical protein